MDCKKVIASYWNFRSSTYTNGMNSFDEEERTVWKQILENSLPSGKRLKVLDIGTGAGFLALLFAEMGHEVTGIDLSEGMLEKAKHNAENMALKIDFFHGDAEKLHFENNTFDLVVNKYLLWTLHHPDNAILEWKRVLKPGGRILSIDGNWFDSRPDRYVKRLILAWTKRLIKKDGRPLVFKNHYQPIRNSLPLYKEISPENISILFSKVGFASTSVDSLLEIQKFQRNRNSFVYRLLDDTSIFLIQAQKAEI